MTDGVAGRSSMGTPNALLITSKSFDRKATAADSTWLATPEVSVAITVRITLPALTVTVSTHAGKKHCSSWRKLALTESAFAAYSSTVPPAFSIKVILLAGTMTAPGCNGGGDGGGRDGGSELGEGCKGGGGYGNGDGGGELVDASAGSEMTTVRDRDAQPIRTHRNAKLVIVSRVCSPATDAAGRLPGGAALPRGPVTVRRRAVLHRDRTTGSIVVNRAFAT
eukprot:scaffold37610_cov66-Phaeocystis_antarctica.AAC.4